MKKISIVLVIILFTNLFQTNKIFAQTEKKTVAISEFINNTSLKSLDNLRNSIPDVLTTNLSKYDGLIILERINLKENLKEISLSQSNFISQDSTIKLGKLIGAKYIISGSIFKSESFYNLNLKLVESETGKIYFSESLDYLDENSIINSLNYLSLKIAKSLGENISLKEIELENSKIQFHDKENNTYLYILGGVAIVGGLIAGTISVIEFWK